MIKREQVYNYVATTLKNDFDCYCTSERNYEPPKFPCVWIQETSKQAEMASMTLTGDIGAYRSTWEIQVFSDLHSGGTKQVRDICAKAVHYFKELGFIQGTTTIVDNEDPSIKRCVASVNRIIGNEDTLPEGD